MLATPNRQLKVFLCHAHEDADRVRALYARLKRAGIEVWLDKENLLPGADWDYHIRKGVQEADVVIVCLSKQFDKDGYRQKEVQIALDTAMEKRRDSIFIIPARLEECDSPLDLKKFQWVDLFLEKNRGWNQLMRALRKRADEIGATLLKRGQGQRADTSSTSIEIKEDSVQTQNIYTEILSVHEGDQENNTGETSSQKPNMHAQDQEIEEPEKTGPTNLNIKPQEFVPDEPVRTGTPLLDNNNKALIKGQSRNQEIRHSSPETIVVAPKKEKKKSRPRFKLSAQEATIIAAIISCIATIAAAVIASPLLPDWLAGIPISTYSPTPPIITATDWSTATYTPEIATATLPISTSIPSETKSIETVVVEATSTQSAIDTITASLLPNPTSTLSPVIRSVDSLMQLIPAGEFVMGSNYEDLRNTCRHFRSDCFETQQFMRNYSEGQFEARKMYLDSFYIDMYEVRKSDYQFCVADARCQPIEGSQFSNASFQDYPVVGVTWYMAKNYCEWRGARLPTEAEWEKAARGREGNLYPWGPWNEYVSCEKANVSDCQGHLVPVGSYPSYASPYFINDMVGNAWEWVSDPYSPVYSTITATPDYVDGTEYVVRGGSFGFPYLNSTATYRWFFNEYKSANYIGFRCAKDAHPVVTPTPLSP